MNSQFLPQFFYYALIGFKSRTSICSFVMYLQDWRYTENEWTISVAGVTSLSQVMIDSH